MISPVKKQDIDLWEAWIEYDQFNQQYFGTLYVIGEILVDQNYLQPTIEKKLLKGNDNQLSLVVPERPEGRCRLKEVFYSEQIHDLSQYGSISIFAGQEMIAHFDEIEVLI